MCIRDSAYIISVLNALLKNRIFGNAVILLVLNGYSKTHCLKRLLCFAIGPVSYTHLDVYKRQGTTRDMTEKAIPTG